MPCYTLYVHFAPIYVIHIPMAHKSKARTSKRRTTEDVDPNQPSENNSNTAPNEISSANTIPPDLTSRKARRDATVVLEEALRSSPTQAQAHAKARNTQDSRTPIRVRKAISLLSSPSVIAQWDIVLCKTSNTECANWLRKNETCENTPRDSMNQHVHLQCKTCKIVTHTKVQSPLSNHQKWCRPTPPALLENNIGTVDTNSGTPERFAHVVLPLPFSTTSFPVSSFLKFIKTHEQHRPLMSTETAIQVLPKDARVLKADMQYLAERLWGPIRRTVDEYAFFGLAIDAGIDPVLREHVLVAVLYVGHHQWLMPPMYHPKYGAFSGKDTAEIVIRELQHCLEGARLSKLAYLIVDGCAVNHVARNEASGVLLKVFESIVPLGDADWNDFVTNFQASHPHIVLIPCIGHLLNNVAKDASKDYEDTPLFQLRKYYTQAFHGQGTRRAEYAGVALEVRLTEFDETSQSAEETLFQWYGMLGSKQLDEASKEQALATLRNALTSPELSPWHKNCKMNFR